jgi:cytoskeleton protein RodZ
MTLDEPRKTTILWVVLSPSRLEVYWMSKKRTPKIPCETPGAATVSLGTRLREARDRAGMTPRMLHEKTRVPLEAISALEEERYEALPAAVYVRGFIKLLCGELKLPYDELTALLPSIDHAPSAAALTLLDLPTAASTRESGDKEEEKQTRVSTALVLFILVVIASLAISYFASQKERESLQTPSASETTHLDVTG